MWPFWWMNVIEPFHAISRSCQYQSQMSFVIIFFLSLPVPISCGNQIQSQSNVNLFEIIMEREVDDSILLSSHNWISTFHTKMKPYTTESNGFHQNLLSLSLSVHWHYTISIRCMHSQSIVERRLVSHKVVILWKARLIMLSPCDE